VATVHSLHYLFEAHQKNLITKFSGFESALDEIAAGWKELLLEVVPSLSPERGQALSRRIVSLQGQVRGMLNKMGYDELAKEFVTGFDESLVYGETLLANLGKPDVMLTKFRADTLKNLKAFDLSAFEEIGNASIRELSKQLTLNTLTGKSKAAVIADMEHVLGSQFKSKAVSYAETALWTFDRTSNMALWESAEIEKFMFSGPKDKLNRPFCKSHVGKIYILDEIKKMSNGSSLPNALTYGGGPRCRHGWLPQPEP
jgi:hypothetical protein